MATSTSIDVTASKISVLFTDMAGDQYLRTYDLTRRYSQPFVAACECGHVNHHTHDFDDFKGSHGRNFCVDCWRCEKCKIIFGVEKLSSSDASVP